MSKDNDELVEDLKLIVRYRNLCNISHTDFLEVVSDIKPHTCLPKVVLILRSMARTRNEKSKSQVGLIREN